MNFTIINNTITIIYIGLYWYIFSFDEWVDKDIHLILYRIWRPLLKHIPIIYDWISSKTYSSYKMNKYFKLFSVFVLSNDKYIVFHFVTRQKKVTSPQAPMKISLTDNIRLLLYASFRQLAILMFIKRQVYCHCIWQCVL